MEIDSLYYLALSVATVILLVSVLTQVKSLQQLRSSRSPLAMCKLIGAIRMTPPKTRRWLLIISIGIVAICLLGVLLAAGWRHEAKKLRSLLVVTVLVLLFQYLVGDLLRFVGVSLYATLRKQQKTQLSSDLGRTAGDHEPNADTLLQLRLASCRSQMAVPPAHYNESLNVKYRLIAHELWLYGKYFFLLLLLVVGSRDYLAYYNTNTITTVMSEMRLDKIDLEAVATLDELWIFLERIMVRAFNDAKDYEGEPIKEPGWVQFGIAKLLGVVRLRQVRWPHDKIDLGWPHFDVQNYLPSWQPFQSLRYIDKYWRIYEPWMQRRNRDSSWFSHEHYGHLHTYDENNGYVALLARDANNSLKILSYLRNNSWLDHKTAALFMDFTLYNVDSNLFSVCTIMVEQTPFGHLLSSIYVQSVELQMNLDHMSAFGLLVLLLYVLQLIQFIKVLILNAWYGTNDVRSAWNIVDWIIVVLNLLIFVLLTKRENKVAELLAQFENSVKLQFVDFRIPAQIDYLTTLTLGFLICLTTIRLWKVLQFARAFRLFTRTLHSARNALLTLSLIIVVFLFAIGTSSYIINGNNSKSFTKLTKSFTSSMSFSFGFSQTVSPRDLIHGGATLGFILYALLMFLVAILLLNIFITVICDYFKRNKESPDDSEAAELSFCEFLKVEYAWLVQCLSRCSACCRSKPFDPKRGTLKQNIEQWVRRVEHQVARRRRASRATAGPPYGRQLRSLSQVRYLTRILNYQIAFLRRHEKRIFG